MELKCQTYHLKRKPQPQPPKQQIKYVYVRDRYHPDIYHSKEAMNRGFYIADAVVNDNLYRIYLYCHQSGQRQCRVLNIRYLGEKTQTRKDTLPVTSLKYLGLDNSIIGNYLN